MVNYFGGNVFQNNNEIICSPLKKLIGQCVEVQGYIFGSIFIAAAILPNSELIIKVLELSHVTEYYCFQTNGCKYYT